MLLGDDGGQSETLLGDVESPLSVIWHGYANILVFEDEDVVVYYFEILDVLFEGVLIQSHYFHFIQYQGVDMNSDIMFQHVDQILPLPYILYLQFQILFILIVYTQIMIVDN